MSPASGPQFSSRALPSRSVKYARSEVLTAGGRGAAAAVLRGLSSSDFGPALTQFLGTSHGLSAATITRLIKDWQDEATTFLVGRTRGAPRDPRAAVLVAQKP